MNIRLGDSIASVRPTDAGSMYDARAEADAIAAVWERLSASDPAWTRMGPNFAKHAGTGQVVNLYNAASKDLSTAPIVSKTEVIVQKDDGSRDRYLLTPDELASVKQTGILPKSANVSAAFADALAWTTEGTEPARQSAPWGLALAAVAAYFAWKG